MHMIVDLLCSGFTITLKPHLLGRSHWDESKQRYQDGECISRWAPKCMFLDTGRLKAGTDPTNAKTRSGNIWSVHWYVKFCRFSAKPGEKRGEKQMAFWALSCVSFRGLLIVIQSQTNTQAPLWPQCKQANASAQISASLQTRLSCFWPRQKFRVMLHVRTRTRTLQPTQIMWV